MTTTPHIRLALVPFNPTVGDLADTTRRITATVQSLAPHAPDLVVFPELVLSGYPPRDLLLREGFVTACAAAARDIGAVCSKGLTLILGVPLPGLTGGVSNALIAFRDGREVAIYRKRLLPTYDVFDEDRYFEPGDQPCVIDVHCQRGPAARVGLAICEDLWRGDDAGFSSRYAHSADPVAELVRNGASLILAPSASPFVLGKGHRHRAILAAHASRHAVHVASLNQLGGNDDLIFDGHAFLYAPDGSLRAAGRGFDPAPVIIDVPLGTSPAPTPAGPEVSSLLLGDDMRLLFEALRLGTRDYLAKTGFKKALIGLSGGIDSALTAALAVSALGPSNVQGVAMPSKYSSDHSLADAFDLARRLDVSCITIPIHEPFTALGHAADNAFETLGQPTLGAVLPDLTEENLQSRIRGTLLMTLSNRTGAIVLTTGNKSELAVGYATLYGDMNGGLAPLADLTKQHVYALSRYINAHHAELGFTTPPIPESTLTKAPSAELRPDQKDQDSLPPYDLLDEVVARYVEQNQSVARIIQETGFDHAIVARIARLTDLAEYKRKQAAIALKVTTVAFGPGRRYPNAHRYRP